MSEYNPEKSRQIGWGWLVIVAIATVLLWQVPWGNYIIYPFTILATWFHEMGHGLTAILMGGNFHKLLLFSNGSGMAYNSGPFFLGNIGQALVAMGGPLGPAIAGGFLIISSRRYKSAHLALMILGCFMLLSVLLWVRSPFGIVAISLWGLLILAISQKTSQLIQGLFVQFLGLQAIISTYQQKGYLFGATGVNIDGRGLVSDTGKMAQLLLLPHWFWASLIVVVSTLIFVQSIRIAYGSDNSD